MLTGACSPIVMTNSWIAGNMKLPANATGDHVAVAVDSEAVSEGTEDHALIRPQASILSLLLLPLPPPSTFPPRQPFPRSLELWNPSSSSAGYSIAHDSSMPLPADSGLFTLCRRTQHPHRLSKPQRPNESPILGLYRDAPMSLR